MYYLLKDNDNAVCMPNTNDNCGESGKTCENDTYCMNGYCKSNCDDGYELCQGIGCVNYQNVTSCGGCNPCNIEHALAYECLYTANNPSCQTTDPGSGTNTNSCCKPKNCESGYHVKGNECVQDSIDECGSNLEKCTTSYENTYPVCINGQCSFKCNDDFGNCNNNTSDGCEFKLSDYGLSSCSTCDTSGCDINGLGENCYMACGSYIAKDSIIIPLCLKQGHYYKNYEGDSKTQVGCHNNSYKYHKNYFKKSSTTTPSSCSDYNNNYINFDYQNINLQGERPLKTNFLQEHFYKLVSRGWNSEKFSWSSEHCALACTGNRNFSSDADTPHTDASGNKIEAWSHQCEPKQECDQFDSFEINSNGGDSNHNKFYFDYGCGY